MPPRASAAPAVSPPIRPGAGPLYLQVRNAIVGRIASGAWPPGTALPSEQGLARSLGVSQGTVRKALDALAAGNVVVRQQGKGTYVATHSPERALFHFFHLIGEDGSRVLPDGRVIACRRRRADDAETAALSLGPREWVIRIDRVRNLAGRPAIVERITVPARLFQDLGRPGGPPLPNTLYKLYEEQYGITVARAVERLRAAAATGTEARLLGVNAGAPLLEIDRVAFALDGTAVEWRVSRCDTRRHHYIANLE